MPLKKGWFWNKLQFIWFNLRIWEKQNIRKLGIYSAYTSKERLDSDRIV